MSKPIYDKKLVIVGDGAVGKTSLLICYVEGKFPEVYVPTVFNTFVTSIETDKFTVNLSLWDTAGQEEYDRLRPLSYPDTNVILAVFSVALINSYKNIADKWYLEIVHFCPDSIKALAALQIDRRECQETIKKLAAIKETPLDTEYTQELFNELEFHYFFECSAKTRKGVDEMFSTICEAVVNTKKKFHFRCTIL